MEKDKYYTDLLKPFNLHIKYNNSTNSNNNIIGRSIIAKQKYKEGEVIFEETPLLSFVSPYHSNFRTPKYCSNCYKSLLPVQYVQEQQDHLSKDDFFEITGDVHSNEIFKRVMVSQNWRVDKTIKGITSKYNYCSDICKTKHMNNVLKPIYGTQNKSLLFSDFLKKCLKQESEFAFFIYHIYSILFIQFKSQSSQMWESLNRLSYIPNNESVLPSNENKLFKFIYDQFPTQFAEQCNFNLKI